MKKQTYELVLLRVSQAKAASRAARLENKQMGLPSPFMKGGKIYYEMPDGTITRRKPRILMNSVKPA